MFLQIDTIDFADKIGAIYNFNVNVDRQGLFGSNEILDTTEQLHLTKHPNFTLSISLEADSNSIIIPLDNEGSSLKIYGAYNLNEDTIRIPRLPQFKCHFPDTTFSTIVYWKKIDGKLVKPPYRVKKKIQAKRGRGLKKYARKQTMVVNNISYEIKPTLSSVREVISHGHGYKPKHQLDKNGNDKKRLTYIFFDSLIHQYRLIAEIRLKPKAQH